MNQPHPLMKRKRLSVKGSVTVEAAIAIPIFLFAILCLLYLVEFQSITTKLRLNGMQTAKYAADEYSAVPLITKDKLHRHLVNQVGEQRLAQSIVAGGAAGLTIKCENNGNGNDELLVSLSYEVMIPVPQFLSLNIKQKEEFVVKAWTGNGQSGEQERGEIVYVASTGQVYHKQYSCTHLKLSIDFVLLQDVAERRNQNGGRYHPCERCTTSIAVVVAYVTDTGNRYHYSLACSGLKRTIYSRYRHEVPWLGACSRCS